MTVEKCEVLESKGHIYMQWTLAILANTVILTYGLQLGWVSPATKFLQSESSPAGRPLTDSEITWIATLPPLLAIPAVIASLYLVDAYGRKICILLLATLESACWIIKLCPSNVTSLMIARVCNGLVTGGSFHVIPMYVKEISQASLVGTLGSLVILSQNLGVLVMYALGAYLEYYTVLWIVTPIPIVIFLVFLKAPESPAYLVKVEKVKEATQALAFLRGLEMHDTELLSEINAIKNKDDYFKSLPKISFITIFKNKAWRRGFLIMMLVLWGHAYNGTFAIMNYASSLLSSSGLGISPDLQSLFVPIFMTLGSFTSMVIVDKIGRKVLISSSFIVVALSLACFATTQLVEKHGGTAPGWLPILAITIALFGHAVGVSPGPYVVMIEMFNFQIRAKLMGILILNIWFMIFVQMLTLDFITSHLGTNWTFYWFSVINIFGAVVVIFLMPETRRKSVEEIEEELRGTKAREEK